MAKILSRFLFAVCLIAALSVQVPMAFAEEDLPINTPSASERAKEIADEVANEASKAAEKTTDKIEDATADVRNDAAESTESLLTDLKKARDILMNGAGDNSFARGLLIAFLQPAFLASMFCLGLLAGQMSEKLKHIWVLPVLVYVATFIGAFITVYHSDWKPEFGDGKYLNHLQSTDAVLVVIGVAIGIAVGFNFTMPGIIAMLGAAAIGLILGFSQTADMAEHNNSPIPFWAGFGLSGLLLNIFGIGFETFFQSINLKLVTRLVGIATAALSLFIGAKLF